MICKQCGACCIAPSISSFIPGMPEGKPANTRCVNLDSNNRCKIFNKPERPLVCSQFKPEVLICENPNKTALEILKELE